MAKVIEYYIPERFRKAARWVPPDQRGKIIEFPVPEKKSAWDAGFARMRCTHKTAVFDFLGTRRQ